MATNAVPKRCVECKKVLKGTRGKAQWCPCGGEMIAIPYGARRKRARRAS